jgi:hypothetical protein
MLNTILMIIFLTSVSALHVEDAIDLGGHGPGPSDAAAGEHALLQERLEALLPVPCRPGLHLPSLDESACHLMPHAWK